jgi:hypothetical protein
MPKSNPMDSGQAPGQWRDAALSNAATLSLAERRARTLAPTIFCPTSTVEQCIRQASQSRVSS